MSLKHSIAMSVQNAAQSVKAIHQRKISKKYQTHKYKQTIIINIQTKNNKRTLMNQTSLIICKKH